MLGQLVAAFMLLTRLPVARFNRSPPLDMARAVWAFPVVGIFVGALGAAVYWLAYRVGMPPSLASAWTLAATMAVTGALHEDGLADTADGFGGGRTPARKMEIMRDSRIGSYGVLALSMSLLLRVGAIEALERPPLVASALVVAAMLGRSGIVILLLLLGPARSDGMGAAMAKPPVPGASVALVLAALAAFHFLQIHFACVVIGLAVAACFVMVHLTRRQIGGYTGDVLGATEQVVECIVLSALACFVHA